MKKIGYYLLALALLLCGCARIEAADSRTQPVAAPVQTEPETQASTKTDAGIRSVVMDGPETLTFTPATADQTLTLRFTGVDPTGAPAEGRSCRLLLLRGAKVLQSQEDFRLNEGAETGFALHYDFSRYMTKTGEQLTLRLEYGGERLDKAVDIRLENDPDEVYAAQSEDPLPYYVDVLRNENVVIVYGKGESGEYDQIVKVFLCSTGTATPSGRYSIGWKVPWRALFGYVYGQYAMHVTGNILFHSVPYYSTSKDRLESAEFNKLGTSASMGCIRMAVGDVKWIYDNCPTGTGVHIYDVTELPVEKPEPLLLDLDDPRAGWDPTDPDEENPWNN